MPTIILLLYFVLIGLPSTSSTQSWGQQKCPLGMFSYSSDCSQWSILSIIALQNCDVNRTNAAVNVLTEATRQCGGESSMQLFLPGRSNSGDSTYSFYPGSSFLQTVTPEDVFVPGNATTTMEMLLTYLANSAVTRYTQAGAIFILTDLSCSDQFIIDFMHAFLISINNTVYTTTFFFIDDKSCPYDCNGYTCSVQYGIPEYKEDYSTCVAGPQSGTTRKTSTQPTSTTTKGGGYVMPTSLELALVIGIPSIVLIILCAICACCCCKCIDAKSRMAQLHAGERKHEFEKFNDFWRKWKTKGGTNVDPSAPSFEVCEDGIPIPPPANFAVLNHYMDIAQLAKNNKKDYWEFNSKNVMIHDNEVLGAGAFATVYRATVIGKLPLLKAVSGASAQLENTDDGRLDAAVKRLPAHADDQNRKDFFHEMEFMKRLGYHVHLIAMLGCISDQWDPLIVVEYCQHGDLLRFIRSHRSDFFGCGDSSGSTEKPLILSVKNLVSFAWQISDGMSYMSSRGFVHRDLAARNVLVTKNLVMKVSDFGLCRYTDQALYTAKGGKLPIKWMSTEALKFGEFSPKSDVWSFGVTLWELFSLGETPYNAVQPTDMLIHLEDGNRLPRPQFCPNEIYDIMQECWNEDSVVRPNFDEVRAKLTLMLNLNDESYGYLTVVAKDEDNSTCPVEVGDVFKL